MTDDAFLAHYTAVAEGAPIPVLLYNYTALTGVTLSIKVVARLAEHPNIVGMKESGGDIGYISSLVDETPDDFSVLVGSAPTFYVSLLSGAVGGIMALAAVAPGECVELYNLVQSRRYGDARQLQKRLTPLARLVTRAYGVAGLKIALDLLGYVGGSPRPPLRPGGLEAAAALGGALDALGMLTKVGMPVAPVAPEVQKVGKTERERC
jgi:4-hydroxy-2-oxoglutarate aldolase